MNAIETVGALFRLAALMLTKTPEERVEYFEVDSYLVRMRSLGIKKPEALKRYRGILEEAGIREDETLPLTRANARRLAFEDAVVGSK